jgi:hypothetical protein
MPRFIHFTALDPTRSAAEVRAFCDERFGVDQWGISYARKDPVLALMTIEAYAIAKAELGPPVPVHAGPLPGAEEDRGEAAEA